jgi:Na+-transporting methylmalonyl-CoA/oxaloacetate decarboxylase gamma subunit
VTTLAASSASSNAEPGTLAFIIVFCLCVALVFLFRSMSKHLRRVNAAARQEEEAAAKDEAAKDPANAGKPRGDS